MSIHYVFIKRSEVTLIAPVWLRYIVFVQMFFHGSLVLVYALPRCPHWIDYFIVTMIKLATYFWQFWKVKVISIIVFWTGSINNPNNPPLLPPLKNLRVAASTDIVQKKNSTIPHPCLTIQKGSHIHDELKIRSGLTTPIASLGDNFEVRRAVYSLILILLHGFGP